MTMNRMRCKASDEKSWTMMRVRELRERLKIPAFDPTSPREEPISTSCGGLVRANALVSKVCSLPTSK